jgi:hypothetical protein
MKISAQRASAGFPDGPAVRASSGAARSPSQLVAFSSSSGGINPCRRAIISITSCI